MSNELETLERLKRAFMQRHGDYRAIADRIEREKAEAKLVMEELMQCMFAIDDEIAKLKEPTK